MGSCLESAAVAAQSSCARELAFYGLARRFACSPAPRS